MTSKDPVAQALEQLRAAGAQNVGKVPEVPRRSGSASAKNKPINRPTGFDGRADRSYRDPKKASDLLSQIVQRQGWSKKMSVGQIMNAWPELVGDKIAEHCEPVRYHAEQQRLIIQCDSTSWATQLRLMQQRILQNIARKVGNDVVATVEIRGPHNRVRSPGRLRVKGRGPRDDFG